MKSLLSVTSATTGSRASVATGSAAAGASSVSVVSSAYVTASVCAGSFSDVVVVPSGPHPVTAADSIAKAAKKAVNFLYINNLLLNKLN